MCKCESSQTVVGCLSVGNGPLDNNGFFTNPCWDCAREKEKADKLPVNTVDPFDPLLEVTDE